MQGIRSRHELQAQAEEARHRGLRLALVPTMGALHAGHLALVEEAARRADWVCVSIFVNPAQFDARADLEAYPRTLAEDLAACERAGADLVFLPEEADLYPDGHQTWVEVAELARPLEGVSRPGHFRGVATVVTKLLLAAKPHLAVFGEKDFQQLAVIRRLVRDLGFDVEVVGVATLRESDGLALSSRNVRLRPDARVQARALARALEGAELAVAGGETRSAALLALARLEIEKEPLASIDYVELRDPETFEAAPAQLDGPALLALAVRFPSRDGDAVRLIDNRVLAAGQPAREERT